MVGKKWIIFTILFLSFSISILYFNDIKPLAFGFASYCSGISISAGSSLEFLLDRDELLSMPRLGRIRLNGFLYVQIPTLCCNLSQKCSQASGKMSAIPGFLLSCPFIHCCQLFIALHRLLFETSTKDWLQLLEQTCDCCTVTPR